MSKSKEGAASEAVLAYLIRQNRPYSAQDLFQNMGKDLGKTAVVKALEHLAGEKLVREKVYGKQKVYVASQDNFPTVDESKIKEMDERITQLNGRIQLQSEELRKHEAELKALNSCLSTDDARAQLSQIYPEIEKLGSKLSDLKKGTVLISKEEKDEVYKARERFVKEWRKRKRIASDILDAILEGYPKTKKHLLEEIGIETDEDYNVKPPDI